MQIQVVSTTRGSRIEKELVESIRYTPDICTCSDRSAHSIEANGRFSKPMQTVSFQEVQASTREHATVLSQGLLAQQVPSLPVFSGDSDKLEGSFVEWHEQLQW